MAFVAWSLTRLVDGVTAYNTLEYDVSNKAKILADGKAGFALRVKFTNLSGDTPLRSLKALVSAPHSSLRFAGDIKCAVQPPAWAGKVTCESFASGANFESPMLVAGTYSGFEVNYTRPPDSNWEPVLRIQPDESQNFRLVKAGAETFAAKHQTAILMTLMGGGLLLLLVSLAAGVKEERAAS